MAVDDFAMQSFIAKNQRGFFELLFSDHQGEWHEIIGDNPNQMIIKQLGNPKDINELILFVERKIEMIEQGSELPKVISSLKEAVENYKNQTRIYSFDEVSNSNLASPVSSSSYKTRLVVRPEDNEDQVCSPIFATPNDYCDFGNKVSKEEFNNKVAPETKVSSPKAESFSFRKLIGFFSCCFRNGSRS